MTDDELRALERYAPLDQALIVVGNCETVVRIEEKRSH
jgi:hypothetical protein